MNIEFYCPRWGSEQLDWDLFFEKVKNAEYDGVECGVAAAATEKELNEIWNLAAKHSTKLIIQHYDTYEADFSKHFDLYCSWLEKVKSYPCEKINSQTGKDFFSLEQNKTLIGAAASFSEKTGIAVLHETHRNKFLFAAHVSKASMEQLPAMKITLDASHWVCVAESYLDDQVAAMELAIKRAEHVHARVGY